MAANRNCFLSGILRLRQVGLLGIGLALLGRIPAGATEPKWPTITDPAMVFSMPTDEKSQVHPLRLQGRVSYYDSHYGLFWIERDDHLSVFVPLSAKRPAMRTGQYVVIEGTITPTVGLSADDVTVRVIEENAPATLLETEGRINDLNTLANRLVNVDGFVDGQQLIDSDHVRLILIVENRPVVCWLKPDDPDHVPDWRDHFVRVSGLYSMRFDPSNTNAFLEIWMAGQTALRVQGIPGGQPANRRSVTAINELYRMAPGTEVRVLGAVKSHQIGTALTLDDGTGQVEVRSIQTRHVLPGSVVEAVGQVELSGSRWVVDRAIYRPALSPAAGSGPEPHAAPGVLTSVDQVKAIGNANAAHGLPVDLRGTVTWSQLDADYFYLQDLTGGVRVHYDRTKTGFFQFVKHLEVRGVTSPAGSPPPSSCATSPTSAR